MTDPSAMPLPKDWESQWPDDIPTHLFVALYMAGIRSPEHLLELGPENTLALRGVGPVSMRFLAPIMIERAKQSVTAWCLAEAEYR